MKSSTVRHRRIVCGGLRSWDCQDVGMVNVKFCGMTSLDDARAAVELGAWAVGVILWPESVRSCDQTVAGKIANELRRDTEIVGVFVNQQIDHVAGVVDLLGLSMVQLHGDEGPSYCEEIRRRTGCAVMKAQRVKDQSSLQAIRRFKESDFHLLDSYVAGVPGGTGTTFDWRLARGYTAEIPVVLSGGLTPDNVGAAIQAVEPFAVDVASGVEVSPGVKDHAKMTAFLRAVEQADRAVA